MLSAAGVKSIISVLSLPLKEEFGLILLVSVTKCFLVVELSLLILRLRLAWVKLGIFNFFFSSLFRQLGLELCFVPKDTLLECFPIFCILSKLSIGWSLKLGVFTLLLDLDFFLW